MSDFQIAAFIVALPFLTVCFAFISYEVSVIVIERGDQCKHW